MMSFKVVEIKSKTGEAAVDSGEKPLSRQESERLQTL